MDDEDNSLNVLLGLLDFHSDRATAHASFVVASIFGIYAVLFSFENYFNCYVGKIVFALTYISLTGISFYSFLNFSKYASLAHAVLVTMQTLYFKNEEVVKDFDKNMQVNQRRSMLLRNFMRLMENTYWKKWKTKVFFFLWVFSVIAPFLWILFTG